MVPRGSDMVFKIGGFWSSSLKPCTIKDNITLSADKSHYLRLLRGQALGPRGSREPLQAQGFRAFIS